MFLVAMYLRVIVTGCSYVPYTVVCILKTVTLNFSMNTVSKFLFTLGVCRIISNLFTLYFH